MPESVTSQVDAGSMVKIHHRQGCDTGSITETKGCFNPQVCGYEEDDSAFASRNWAIVAATSTLSAEKNAIQLFAIPLGNKATDDDMEGDDEVMDDDSTKLDNISFYLTAQIILPSHYTIQDMAFYGDDGRSSLSSDVDSGTGTEGRQALGLLLSQGVPGAGPVTQELWILRYDDLRYEASQNGDMKPDKVSLKSNIANDECKAFLRPVPVGCDEIPGVCGLVFAKSKFKDESKPRNEHDADSLLHSV